MKVKYAHSNELNILNPPDVFYRLALAYIDSAIQLCLVMNSKKFKQTYSRGDVIMFLFYHSVELFLKALIYKNNLSEELFKLKNKMHDLESLNDILKKSSIIIDIPFKRDYSNVNQTSIGLPECIPLDQFFRYHIDKYGNYKNIVSAFSSKSMIKDLRDFKKKFLSFESEFDTRDRKFNYFYCGK